MRPGIRIKFGQRFSAVALAIAERTPNLRAS